MALPRLSPWIGFVCGIFLMGCSGTIYLFPVYSERLGHLLGFSVSDMQAVGTLMNVGTWCGVIGGFFYDWAIQRFGGDVGARMCGCLGALLLFIGYGGFFLAASKAIRVSYMTLGCFAFVMGQGSSLTYTSALNPNAANFEPHHKGKIMGTLVCFFGLSAGVLSLVFKGLCHRSVVSLMGVLASVLPLLALCSSVCMTVTPRSSDTFHHSKADPLHASYFKRRTRLALVLVSTVIVVIAVDDLGDAISPSFPPSFWFCVAVIVLLGSYVLLPCGTPQLMFRGHQRSQSLTASASLLKVGIDEPERGSPPASVRSSSSLSIAPPTRLEVHSPTLLQCFRKLEYWLLFAAFFVCIGASISSLDNLDRIVDSKSVPDADNAQVKVVATSLFSLFNTGGRLLAGFLSDRCVMYVSRPAFLLAACTVMFVSQIWLAFASVDMLYAVFSLQGLAHGGLFCMVPMLACHLFGVKHFGANYGFLGLGPAVGSELLGAVLAPRLFERACGSSSAQCFHTPAAFRTTILINAGLCAIGAVAAFLLKQRALDGWRVERASAASRLA